MTIKKAVWSIVETSPGIWRCTVDGRVLGDSRGFDREGARRDALAVVARDPQYKEWREPAATFEQWAAAGRPYDVMPEDEAGVYGGLPGRVYEAGFIVTTDKGFMVPLPQSEHHFGTLADAERFLWTEWCADYCGPEAA